MMLYPNFVLFRHRTLALAACCMLLLTGCAQDPLRPPTQAATAPLTNTAPPNPLATPRPVGSVGLTPELIAPKTALEPVQGLKDGPQEVVPLQPPAELWDRIRRGFAMPNLEHPLVAEREKWYASRPEYLERMTGRSSKYLFHIVEELEKRNMPTELALLPFIESAFNPQAVSSAKAAGMWQFMPQTGKYFSLKQNVFRDDRRDVLASTRAALDYLQKLYGMFGDWHLALAAYNWGEGSVGRAIAKNKRAGLGTGYLDLNMPAETRLYVPKLQAVKNIVDNPQAFQAELPFIENHPYFQQVSITRDMDVAVAAQLADVKLDDFKALNPSLNRPVILAAGTPQILLPWANAEVFQRNFDAYASGKYASWTAWTVPTTMKPAEAAKRVGMSESDLRSINSIPPRMRIKAGSTLLVRRSSKGGQDVSSTVADNGHLSLAPEVVTRRTSVKARKGESVASVAKRYKLAPDNVAEWNKVGLKSVFRPGQAVVLYLPVKPKTIARRSGANHRTTKLASKNKATSKAKTKLAKAGGTHATRKPI